MAFKKWERIIDSDSDLTVDYMYLNLIFNIAGNSFRSIEFCELCGLPPNS